MRNPDRLPKNIRALRKRLRREFSRGHDEGMYLAVSLADTFAAGRATATFMDAKQAAIEAQAVREFARVLREQLPKGHRGRDA